MEAAGPRRGLWEMRSSPTAHRPRVEGSSLPQGPSGNPSSSLGLLLVLVLSEVRKPWEWCQITAFSLDCPLMSNSNKQNVKKVLNSNALSKVTSGENAHIYQVLNPMKGFCKSTTNRHPLPGRQRMHSAMWGVIPLIFLLLTQFPL